MASKAKIYKRRALVKRYLLKYPGRTQEQVCQYLAKKNIFVTQATISRDVLIMGLRPTGDGYVLDETGIDWKDEIKDIFKFDPPRIHNTQLYTVSIIVNKGTASSIARLIEDEYGDSITGTVSGEKLVIVYTTRQKKAEDIKKTLLTIRGSIKVDVADDDQPTEDEVQATGPASTD